MSSNLTMCSFCGKSHTEVEQLISGPGVYICDSCVTLCANVLAKEREKANGLAIPPANTPLSVLQQWYRAECESQRRSPLGVEITARGSEGWRVTIDLEGTIMEGATYEPVLNRFSNDRWFECKVEGDKFKGEGSESSLEQILSSFAAWLAARKQDLRNAGQNVT